MDDRSLFISSCSRRELARRRPTHSPGRMTITFALLVLAIVAVAAFAALGGL